MATWTSLVVLSLAVVSTLSFPRPDAEYRIPTVGLGSRAQYYVLHSDGTYKYGYDSGDGLHEQSMAQSPGQVSGAFGYKDPTGADIKLEYTADERGFIPQGAHLPVAPQADFGSRVSAHPAPAAPTTYEAASSASVHGSTSPAKPVEIARVRSTAAGDGSYSFGYETSSSSRSESAGATNSVTGQYAFVADDGVNRAINYIAGAETGYIVEGDSLPQGPSVPGAESGIPTGRILPVLSEAEANALAAATSGSQRVTYTAGTQASSSAAASHASSASVRVSPSAPSDASYSFNYDAGDSARSESADSNLNIQGTYSFLPPEGDRLTVNYIAGSDTGFVATGDHLPVAPEAEAIGATATAAGSTVYSAPSPAKPVHTYSAPASSASSSSATSSDASYSFQYDAEDSDRQESADANLNVQGSYSFVPPEGHRLTVNYIAGSETGFVATGDHLPVAPEAAPATYAAASAVSPSHTHAAPAPAPATYSAPASRPVATIKSAPATPSDASYSFSYNAEDSSRSESADANLNVEGSYSFVPPEGHRLTVNYVAGSETGFVATGDHLPVAPEVAPATYTAASAVSHSHTHAAPAPAPATYSAPASRPVATIKSAPATPSDASYSFSYDADDSSRSESADANLNVEGSYSFVPPEGHRLTVNYVAGSETGFVATGDHLPVAPEASPATYAAASAVSHSHTHAAPAPAPATYAVPASGPIATINSAPATPSDASYSFSYDAGDSSRSEKADANLNVEGSYSFVPPEGHRLTVNYVAGSETGFVATGDHLPVAPEAAVPSVRGASPAAPAAATYSAPSSGSAPSAATPIEVAQVRSSTNNDGSYSFAYDTSSSSRSESADAHNSVTGHYSFVADDGVNRAINYIAGSETGYIAEGNSLPRGPAVPGAESGIPTGRILPVLSEEEANALAYSSSATGSAPLLKTSATSVASGTPADASYTFAFDSDEYSRTEDADAEGNVVGSYTFVDEHGNEHTVRYVAGRETGFVPEGFPTPSVEAGPRASPATSAGSAAVYSAPSRAATRVSAGTSSATKYSSPKTSSSKGHSSRVVGDVLLHQYDAVNSNKYGYSFTAVRR